MTYSIRKLKYVDWFLLMQVPPCNDNPKQRFAAFTSQGMMDLSARLFGAEELKVATDNYSENRILGRGG
uniref:Uncharacterized protein n=1 Tax=Oryza sativa subsp. japonica TaxID=39947 RepID=Q6Z8D6_ORYSJ|nr:hypothetical protein [Oryza sativa Japonica Group]BAD07883.1 hypothetical protein [Oryza sativa Japonica Group]